MKKWVLGLVLVIITTSTTGCVGLILGPPLGAVMEKAFTTREEPKTPSAEDR
jgi:predicted PurR-regulated permease PerM